MRNDGRSDNENRPVKILRNYLKFVEGSVLMEMGDTKVICTATIDDKVPSFLKETGRGWLTAEYSMLPRSSQTRIPREVTRGKQGGRTHEIQRLIEEMELSEKAVLVKKATWADQEVIVDISELRKGKAGYFSIMIVKT